MSEEIFRNHYKTNYWGDDESYSGRGSNLKATAKIRKEIPELLAGLGDVKSILDIPCGDFYWMSKIDWPDDLMLLGADIVPEIVEAARDRMRGRKPMFQQFGVLDAVIDKLPMVDLILCRDLLGHLPRQEVLYAINNFRRSGAKWLLATTFPQHENGGDIRVGDWRPINLASLYGLPNPITIINEGLEGEFADKSLGLWRLN